MNGEPITRFESNRVRALLAYLAVESSRPHSRETLASLLWPDKPTRIALKRLRSALSNLRLAIRDRQTHPPLLLITRGAIQFNTASDYWLDVEVFEQCIAQGQSADQGISALQAAVDLYRGGFLEGFLVKDSLPFEEWALFKQEQLNRLMMSVLQRLAACYEERSDYEQAQTYARWQIELEPWREEAHRQLMRALVFSGQRSAALAQHDICRRLLSENLGVEPARETAALYERICAGTLDREVEIKDWRSRSDFLELDSNKSQSSSQVPFVARGRELARLDSFLKATLAGQGQVVFVTGDAGSGKTALASEFTRRAVAAHGALVVAAGRCSARSGSGDLYLPFREIVHMLTGDVQAQQASSIIRREHARRLRAALP
ncbi:MAG: BTAD domain-containing putative transcriptional regulator, partial [Anaerolineae bacterium]